MSWPCRDVTGTSLREGGGGKQGLGEGRDFYSGVVKTLKQASLSEHITHRRN